MVLSKVDKPRFEIEHFDGHTDYFLQEQKVKNVIKAMSLQKFFKPKPLNVNDEDQIDIQDQDVIIVTLYLNPNVLKQVEKLETVTAMFQGLQTKYHMKELSNRLFTLLTLMSFKMIEVTKIQQHIDAFNDLLVDLLNVDEYLSDEKKVIAAFDLLAGL